MENYVSVLQKDEDLGLSLDVCVCFELKLLKKGTKHRKKELNEFDRHTSSQRRLSVEDFFNSFFEGFCVSSDPFEPTQPW